MKLEGTEEEIVVRLPNIVKGLYGPEAPKIRARFAPYLKGRVLDVGAGEASISVDAVTVDIRFVLGDEYRNGWNVIGHAEFLPFRVESFDAVVSNHCLEHILNDWTAIHEMWRVLKVGGHLLLYLPLKGLMPSYMMYTAHHRDYEPKDIIKILEGSKFEFDLWDCSVFNAAKEFSFSIVAKKEG